MTELFSASKIIDKGKELAEGKALEFAENLTIHLRQIKKLAKTALIEQTNSMFAIAKAKLQKMKATELQALYMKHWALKLVDGEASDNEADDGDAHEDENGSDDEAVSHKEHMQGRQAQPLKQAFGFAKIAYKVAETRAVGLDPERKALLFKKKAKLSSDFSGVGAAEQAGRFVTSASAGKLVIESTEVGDVDKLCQDILLNTTDDCCVRGDMFDMFPQTVKNEIAAIEALEKPGGFDKIKKVVETAPMCSGSNCCRHKQKKRCQFKRAHVNMSGSPCIQYSKANRNKKGKNGKGAPCFLIYSFYGHVNQGLISYSIVSSSKGVLLGILAEYNYMYTYIGPRVCSHSL